MVPNSFQALAVVLLAILPGFVATTFWARAKTWKGRGTDLITVLQSMAVSAVIVAAMTFPAVRWLYPVRDTLEQHPLRIATWSFFTVFIVPMIGGILFGRVSDWLSQPTRPIVTGRLRKIWVRLWPTDVPPTIWDWAFKSKVIDDSFVVVEFTDKTRVAGVFSAGSLALTSPEPQGVYLRREWTVDENGDLLAEVPNTKGVIITNTASIRTIHILRGGDIGHQRETTAL